MKCSKILSVLHFKPEILHVKILGNIAQYLVHPHFITVNVQLTARFRLVRLVVDASGQVAVMTLG
jgi:hypothetical protein